MLETKTHKVIRLIRMGEWKPALSILRRFRLGFTKEEHRLMEIASDVMNGQGALYRCLGIDTEKTVEDCKAMIVKKYNIAD